MARSKPASTKEHEPKIESLAKEEDISLREAQARVEIEKELEGYLKHPDLEPEISDDLAKIGVHSPSQAASQVLTQGSTIILPMTRIQFHLWLKNKVWDSGRWLAEWTGRIIKAAARHGVRIIFGEEKA